MQLLLLLLLDVCADVLEVNAVDILRLLDEPLLVFTGLLDLCPQHLEIAGLAVLLVLLFHQLFLQVLELAPQLALLVLQILQLLATLLSLGEGLRRLPRLRFLRVAKLVLTLLC